MARITGSWERPIQGVSQQSDKDRIDGQCTLQENLTPSPLHGLTKRVGTRNVDKIMQTVHPDAAWHEYSRGDDESYIIVIEPNSLPRVWDAQGNGATVNVSGISNPYLLVANPKDDLMFKTIADTTFIVNNKIPVAIRPDKQPKNPKTAILYCQYATYGRDYAVEIDGKQVALYTTPDGSDAKQSPKVKTNYVIEQLKADIDGRQLYEETLSVVEYSGTHYSNYTATASHDINRIIEITHNGNGIGVDSINGKVIDLDGNYRDGDLIHVRYYGATSGSKFNTEQNGNTLFITRKDGQSFTISTVDSADGNDLVAVQDSVKQLSNLPPHAPANYVVKIQNNEGYDANSFWLKAESKNSDEQTGSRVKWVESLEPDSFLGFDKATMPHTLFNKATGVFDLTQGDWEDREVGNDDTNPFPSFIYKDGDTYKGEVIKSIGLFQNRLVFTSGEAAVFGRSNNFYNFFRETTQAESDSDPIDAFADADEINNLLHSAVLDGDIVFFAENGQFLISGEKPITKSSLVFKKVTSYPMNVYAAPAVTGESVMFSFTAGNYSGIREMFTDSFTATKRARPITEHVAEYIEGRITDLIASPNINTLLIRTTKDEQVLYVYDWLWQGEQKIQAAFHKWVFEGKVRFASFIQDKVYIVVERNDGVYLEFIPISNDDDDKGLSFPVRLDRREDIDVAYNAQSGRWEWSTSYNTLEESTEFVRGEGCWEPDRGTSVIFETDGSGNYWSYDDLADWQGGVLSCKLISGTKYKSKFIPTQPYIKDGKGRVIGLDRFTLGRVTLNYDSIGNILVTVKDKFIENRKWYYEYNGRRMGSWNNRVGFAPLAQSTFTFPVRLPSERVEFMIETDDYRPFILSYMEWEGNFTQRSKRI